VSLTAVFLYYINCNFLEITARAARLTVD